DAVAVVPHELELPRALLLRVGGFLDRLGVVAFPDRRGAIGNRHGKRESAIERRECIDLAFGDDQRCGTVLQRRIVHHVGVPERLAPALLLPEPLAGCAVLRAALPAMVDERKHDDVAVCVRGDLAFAGFGLPGLSGIDVIAAGCFGIDPPALERLDRYRAERSCPSHTTRPHEIRSGDNSTCTRPARPPRTGRVPVCCAWCASILDTWFSGFRLSFVAGK